MRISDWSSDVCSSDLLIAWDPVKQKPVWTQDYVTVWNGGTLATAGGLVFQGTADGRFVAYAADTGKKLWQTPANTGVMDGPISYTIDGQQYVTVEDGCGGTFRSEEDTPALQYLMRYSFAVLSLDKKIHRSS